MSVMQQDLSSENECFGIAVFVDLYLENFILGTITQ